MEFAESPPERRAVRRDLAVVAAIVAVTGLALAGGYAASRGLVARVAEAHALDLAYQFTRSLAEALPVFGPDGGFVGIDGPQADAVYRFARDIAHIDRMVAVGRDRIVAFDTTGGKTGLFYDRPYIADALEHGRATVKFADADDTSVSVIAGTLYVAEVYVPVRVDGAVVGVFELYLDVAASMASVEDVFRLAYGTFAVAVLLATAAAVAMVHRSLRRRLADLRQMRALRDDADAARNRAERALEQQQRFTANAAHELRTPLAVLRARLDGPEPAADALRRDVDRMGRLVDQLLTMARLEARMVALEDGVDLVAVARDTVARLFPLALAEGKSIELDAPVPVRVRGNGFALEDALRNLIDNALRHSPSGATVDVAVRADPPALEVRDRGPGVPAALRPHLFEPFVHGRERRGAAGLGLAIVAETAALHDGGAGVEDRPGGGAVFRLTLPASAGPIVVPAKAACHAA